ncbi:hypothetical protein B296_00051166 [Ensete ventricosum]|uniref:Uncharacterized protein n=1 Tax=Ensete ventricosum TaxID=4639 RepID=A0A426XQY6_ENSVE|nr:hypothetical protein B296_00051166 [Ensete ventricosum]
MAGACRGGACGRRQRLRPSRRGRLPVAWPQGASPRPGQLPVRCRPRATTLATGAVAHVNGVQCRRLRRAAATTQ